MRTLIAVAVAWLAAAVLYLIGAVVALLAFVGLPLGSSGEPPGGGYFAANLAFSVAAAAAGGWLVARIARDRPLVHGLILALLLSASALIGFSKPASQWPAWYPPALALLGFASAIAGSILFTRGRVG